MDAFTLEVARILKSAQENGGPSYTELAERTSMSRPTIERMLNGKREIKLVYLRELCRELGLNMADVLDDAENASI